MQIFLNNKIIPVVTIANKSDVLAIADRLIENEITAIEITLRTNAALDAIRLLKENRNMTVGAGTILSAKNFSDAVDAGAEFIVSPGLTDTLARVSCDYDIPFIPGITTISESMKALEGGFYYQKFFPAEMSGGIKTLKNFELLLKEVKYFPTGGINEDNYKTYLELPNVFAVGGTWLT